MTKAIFFDLDDTLLRLNTDTFVKTFVTDVGTLFQECFPELTERGVSAVYAMRDAVRATFVNLDPTRTNADIYNEVFSQKTGLSLEVIQSVFNQYQQEHYPRLKPHIVPIENAVGLIERLNDMKLPVVIATNPVFTRHAVQQRMIWGGVDSPRVPYAWVTCIEESHFTKPNPHYYEEILARVGVEADETIMIGDSFENDMLPAAQAGLNTFWIDWSQPLPADVPPELLPNGQGTLADFERLVAEGWLNTLRPRRRTPEQLAPRMIGNVAAIYGLVDTIKPAYWHMRPDPNEWSALEVICHLRNSERDEQRPRLQRIAQEDNPFISQQKSGVDHDLGDVSGENGPHVRDEFWQERQATLAFLSGLQPVDWNRPARHSVFGPTTLLEMAHFTARHDHLHINQLCETVGRCRQHESSA